MAEYSFIIELRSGKNEEIRWSYLASHQQARKQARLIIRDLKERPEYRDPNLRMIIRDADGEVIDVVPF